MSTSIFKDSLVKQFLLTSQSEMTESQINRFIDYLLEYKVIPEVNMKIYSVFAEFEKIVSLHPDKNKSECVTLLTTRLNLNTNTIWNILKDHKGKFTFH